MILSAGVLAAVEGSSRYIGASYSAQILRLRGIPFRAGFEMIKLLICLIASVAIAVCLVQLRQQHLELNHQTSQLHNKIESRQAKLWSQQLQIARLTAPPALQTSIAKQDLKLTNLAPIQTGPTAWIDSPTR